MPAIVNADLFRIVSAFVSDFGSKEKGWCYLSGVLVQPHPVKGVLLVATDGHRLMCAHDETGTSSLDDVIVRLDKATLSACKGVKGETLDRLLHIEGDGHVRVLTGTAERLPVAMAAGAIVDGTFPDWRRVVPQKEHMTIAPAAFNPAYLADFGKAAADLAKRQACSAGLILATVSDGPALIRFRDCPIAFGVLMPMRMPAVEAELPDFYHQTAPVQEQAAA